MTLESGAGDEFLQAGLYTEGLAPEEAIYGAWYYIPAAVTPRAYWVLLKLRSRLDPANPGSWMDVWDVLAHRRKDGSLSLSLYHAGGLSPPANLKETQVPIGRWFHVEVQLRGRADETGRIALRIDGRTVSERQGIPTMPRAISWSWPLVRSRRIGIRRMPATTYTGSAMNMPYQPRTGSVASVGGMSVNTVSAMMPR